MHGGPSRFFRERPGDEAGGHNARSLVALEVTALVSNPHTVHLKILLGADCQFGLNILVEEGGGKPHAPITCGTGGPTIDLAPLDTVTLTRVFGPDVLASVSPGTYALAPVVTQANGTYEGWAGYAQFPIARP